MDDIFRGRRSGRGGRDSLDFKSMRHRGRGVLHIPMARRIPVRMGIAERSRGLLLVNTTARPIREEEIGHDNGRYEGQDRELFDDERASVEVAHPPTGHVVGCAERMVFRCCW